MRFLRCPDLHLVWKGQIRRAGAFPRPSGVERSDSWKSDFQSPNFRLDFAVSQLHEFCSSPLQCGRAPRWPRVERSAAERIPAAFRVADFTQPEPFSLLAQPRTAVGRNSPIRFRLQFFRLAVHNHDEKGWEIKPGDIWTPTAASR